MVVKQHCIWMVEAGVDFLVVDWTNNLWGLNSFSERGVYAQVVLATQFSASQTQQLINATTFMLQSYTQLRLDGIPTPKVVLLLGMASFVVGFVRIQG